MNFRERLERYEKWSQMHRAGIAYRFIAEQNGISHQAVHSFLKRGVPQEHNSFRNGNSLKLKYLACGELKGRERTRMLVRVRDNFTCQDCGLFRHPQMVKKYNSRESNMRGKMKNLDVHHTGKMCGKNSRGYDSVRTIDTLVTLCHKCHFNRPEHRTKRKSV